MKERNKKSKLKLAIGKAISFVTNNADKLDLVLDVIRIISTKSKDEVVQFGISMEYTTEEGKTYKLSLPKSSVKDSSEIQNVIATILTVSANDIGATVTEVLSVNPVILSNAKVIDLQVEEEIKNSKETIEEPIIRKPVK